MSSILISARALSKTLPLWTTTRHSLNRIPLYCTSKFTMTSIPERTANTDVEMTDIEVPFNKDLHIVVAMSSKNGIGRNQSLPWNIPSDIKNFRRLTSSVKNPTKRNVMIMGRKTWESIPSKFKPPKDRFSIVLTKSETSLPDGAIAVPTLSKALELLSSESHGSSIENVFVIGGAGVYKEVMDHPSCGMLHVTHVEGNYDCDTFFPAIDKNEYSVYSATAPVLDKKSGQRISMVQYVRRGKTVDPETLPPYTAARHEEYQYLDLIRDIIDTGDERLERTGTGTIAKFGTQLRFNLRHTFPLLTTKRVYWKGVGVVEELLWFIKGSTSAKILQEKGIHIWDGNSSREFLDRIGLTDREEGDLGPVYGFQWRHFGAKYTNMHADYTGQGIDQLAEVIKKIKENPTDRRMIVSAWNPVDLKQMALPPCHMTFQFFVANGELSCHMYQRSGDMGLGVPFNIASYALLTCMIAQVTGLKRGDFIHSLGDVHVYLNHVDALKTQIKRCPRPLPVLEIDPSIKDIDDFTFDHFRLVGYDPHASVKMKMSA